MFGSSTHRAQKQRDARPKPPSAPAAADALRNSGGPQSPPPTGPQRPGNTGPNGANQQRGGGGIGWISRLVLLLLLLVVGYNIVLWWNPQNNQPTINYPFSALQQQMDAGNVKSITITDQTQITGTLKQADTYGGVKATQFKSVYPYHNDEGFQKEIAADNVQVVGAVSSSNDLLWTILLNGIPILLIIVLFIWITRRASAN